MTVLSITRPADEQVVEYNQFNSVAPEGYDWVLVRLAYTCGAPADATCSFGESAFRVVGSKGRIYTNAMLARPDDVDASQELFGGGKAEVVIGYIVAQDDTGLVVIWDPGSGYRATYFSTE